MLSQSAQRAASPWSKKSEETKLHERLSIRQIELHDLASELVRMGSASVVPCGGFKLARSRLDRGAEMLIDRACPGGGWNAGNGVVYGAEVSPHPDDTAIALLALPNSPQDLVVRTALNYLERTAPTLTSPWSIAWAILALAAHRRRITSLRRVLLGRTDLLYVEDTSTLCAGLSGAGSRTGIGEPWSNALTITRRDFIIGSTAIGVGASVCAPFFC